jgi:hypothetical protein
MGTVIRFVPRSASVISQSGDVDVLTVIEDLQIAAEDALAVASTLLPAHKLAEFMVEIAGVVLGLSSSLCADVQCQTGIRGEC